MSAPLPRAGQLIPTQPACRVLVVASAAAESDELLAVLTERAREQELELALVIASADDPAESARRLRATLARFRAAGLYVREAVIASGDPVEAAVASAASGGAEEVVLATARRRLRRGPHALSGRIATATGLPVTWVPAKPGRPARAADAGRMAAEPGKRERVEQAGRDRHAAGAGPVERQAPERPAGSSPRLLAARVFAAAGLALLALAAAGVAAGEGGPPQVKPVQTAPLPTR